MARNSGDECQGVCLMTGQQRLVPLHQGTVTVRKGAPKRTHCISSGLSWAPWPRPLDALLGQGSALGSAPPTDYESPGKVTVS